MPNLIPYEQEDKDHDEATIESMKRELSAQELDSSFVFRFEGYDNDGAYFSRMHNGALYYFDFLAKVPLINVRRRGARCYWQVSTLAQGIERMKADYRQWQIDLAKAEQAETAYEDEHDDDDIPF